MGLQIFSNIDATSLGTARVQSATDLRAKSFKAFAAGDSTVVDLYLTGQDGLQNIQDYSTVRLGIGTLNARPTGGTWDYGAQTGLAYNVTASALDTAITAETAACTVTELTSFVYKVVFDANGAQTIATVDATSLTPSSTVSIKRLVTGDASTKEEWLVRIYRNPIALVDSFTNITGSGIRGTLNLGTTGVYELLGTGTSAATTIELELTDANGDITTIFQYPLTIVGEVNGEGVTGVATFDSYITSSAVATKFLRGNLIFVDPDNGSDSSGTAYREDLAFATAPAAEAVATTGDCIVFRPATYSTATALSGVDGVTYYGMPGAVLPGFTVATGVTIEIHGDVNDISTTTASANVSLYGNPTTVLQSSAGTIKAYGSEWSYSGSSPGPVYLSGTGSIRLYDSNVTSTSSGDKVVELAGSWSGSFFAKNSEFIATTVTTNEATKGIEYGNSVTGTVQLKDCTMITAQNGTGTAYSIAPTGTATATIYVQGSLNQTHAVATYVTLSGGVTNTNTNYTA